MKFETKLFCDRLFGHALCLFLMPFVFIVGKILRIDHSINPQNVRQIVVAKYFGLGSITHSMPALKALKEKYPAARLIFISRKANQSLFPFIPFIDETIYIDDGSLLKLFKSSLLLFVKLWRKRIDLFFDLEVFSSFGVLISLFSLAKNRFGFFWARSTKFKTYIYTHLLYFNFQMPVRLAYMQLARLGKADINASTQLLPFNLPNDILSSAKEKLQTLIGALENYHGILAMNPNASELSYARRWDIKKFAQTASHFADLGYCIVLLGSQDERTWTGKVFDFACEKSVGGGGQKR